MADIPGDSGEAVTAQDDSRSWPASGGTVAPADRIPRTTAGACRSTGPSGADAS